MLWLQRGLVEKHLRCLAAEFTIWSMACMEKLKVMNSTTGLRFLYAAPTAKPVKPISVIGVSMTLSAPYFCHSPLVTLYAPWYCATSSPMTKTSLSLSISSSNAELSASLTVNVVGVVVKGLVA